MSEKIDLTAFYSLTSGLYLITSSCGTVSNGCIVNTVTQVTAEPAQIAVAVNKQNWTREVIEKGGVFTAAVLTEEAGMDLIGAFGFRSGRDENKFLGFETAKDCLGVPYVTENVAAVFSCKVVQQMDLGTHILFVGEVVEAKKLDSTPPMTYAYYHKVKKGLTPKTAASYQPVETETAEEGKSVWKCSICGYEYEGETLPEGYVCPICGQPENVFTKL